LVLAIHLFERDRWRHREFLPGDGDFDQRRSIVLERLRQHWTHLIRRIGCQSQESRCLGHFREVRVVQVGAEVEEAGSLHFEFNKSQRVVLEDNDLHRQIQLPKRQQIAHAHGETAITR
jgi:hypothetical protein